jgi:hypothetical protein
MKHSRSHAGSKTLLRSAIGVALGLAACGASTQVVAADAEDPFKIFVADRYSYEDNLFRVPDEILNSDPALVSAQSFDDYVNRLSGGVEARVDASRQVFTLNLRFDDVRYSENDYLDHHGGSGDLKWNFDIGSHWSGLLDAHYDRAQAGFSNYVLFVKDIVETQSYTGELRFKIGSRWALLGGATVAESTHTAEVRETSNMESEAAKVGIEYSTPNNSLLAFDYAVTEATFPVAERLFGAEIGFEQTLPMVRARYVFSEKTRITARAGYLTRDYTNPNSGDYSGNVWNVLFYWEPRTQLYFDLEAYHELKSYADAETDYFVAKGIRLAPTWAPTVTMNFELALSVEDQSYRATATPISIVGPGREDDVKSAALTWSYTPRDYLSLLLAYRWTDRETNRLLRDYEAEVASAQIKIAF